MHVKREDVDICVSSPLKHVSIEEHLHCVTIEFEVQFCICITSVGDSLTHLGSHICFILGDQWRRPDKLGE
jgi:hypothetical protein